MSSIPRGAAAAIRAGRRGVGETPDPLAEHAQPAPPTAGPAASKRPAGTTRLSVDVPADLGERFRARAKSRRFTQSDALAGALILLEALEDAAYERHLSSAT